MKRPPLYLQCRGAGRYYVRIAVPKDLRPCSHGSEIKWSLRTTDVYRARGLAYEIAAKARQAFEDCRAMTNRKPSPVATIDNIVYRLARDGVQEWEISHPDPAVEREPAVQLFKELGNNLRAADVPSASPVSEPVRLSTIIDEFSQEKKRANAWTKKQSLKTPASTACWWNWSATSPSTPLTLHGFHVHQSRPPSGSAQS